MTSITSTTTSTPAAAPATSQTTQSALASLTGNYQTFLTMLTTQLQNQDPTSPMDSNAFTTELVQFSGVEQQINTNSNLQQLIGLMQGNNVLQSSQIIGKTVQATSNQLSLQQGSAQIQFNDPNAGPVQIAITNSQGVPVATQTVSASQGANTWTWNGQGADGVSEPDGSYGVTVNAVAADGSTSALPFTISGKVTAVQQQGSAVQVQLGSLLLNMSAVTGVGN